MTRLALALTLAAAPALADPARHVWPGPQGGSWVEIHEPTETGAVASVTFRNAPVHTRDEELSIIYGDVEVLIVLDWQADGTEDERITVIPPIGYIALPPEVTVPEGETETLHIYQGIS